MSVFTDILYMLGMSGVLLFGVSSAVGFTIFRTIILKVQKVISTKELKKLEDKGTGDSTVYDKLSKKEKNKLIREAFKIFLGKSVAILALVILSITTDYSKLFLFLADKQIEQRWIVLIYTCISGGFAGTAFYALLKLIEVIRSKKATAYKVMLASVHIFYIILCLIVILSLSDDFYVFITKLESVSILFNAI